MAPPFGLHCAAETLVIRVRGIASSILLEVRASAVSVVAIAGARVVQVSNIRPGDLWPTGQRARTRHSSTSITPPSTEDLREHEEGRSVRTARGVRADPHGAARARVPLAVDHGGQGLGSPEGHHRALPR